MRNYNIHLEYYDELAAAAKAQGQSLEEFVAYQRAGNSYERQLNRQFFDARTKLRDGLGKTIDPDNTDVDEILELTGLPVGRASKNFVRAELKELKKLRDLSNREA